ncbi:MAG: hypothetical protein E7458_10540, partial [Ruminococcaceae bacterium]|nr:hypothetical protein [Oscillospiraceae bacterium]
MKFSVRKNFIEGSPADRRIYLTRAAQRVVLLLAVAAFVLGVYYFRGAISEWFRELQTQQQEENQVGREPYSRIAFEPDSENVFELFDDCLAV